MTRPDARFFALIPCAGQGSRAGTAQPKQYEPVAGQPMVMHTLAAFAAVSRLAPTLVVTAPGDPFFAAFPEIWTAPVGGATRAASVRNGLAHLVAKGARPQDWVLVHDAARCLITPQAIEALIDACAEDPVGGLLAHRLPDTLKQGDGSATARVRDTLDRSDKWLAQTPQMFRLGLLGDALDAVGDGVTDESGAVEALGLQPRLVPGGAWNFKVTYPDDFALAEAVLSARQRQAPQH